MAKADCTEYEVSFSPTPMPLNIGELRVQSARAAVVTDELDRAAALIGIAAQCHHACEKSFRPARLRG